MFCCNKVTFVLSVLFSFMKLAVNLMPEITHCNLVVKFDEGLNSSVICTMYKNRFFKTFLYCAFFQEHFTSPHPFVFQEQS